MRSSGAVGGLGSGIGSVGSVSMGIGLVAGASEND